MLSGIEKLTFAIALTLSTSWIAHAEGLDGLHASSEYPDPKCIEPDLALVKPVSEEVGGMWSPNNRRRIEFNKEAKAYASCMHAYISTANAHLLEVRNEANAEIKKMTDDANSALKAIEGKIHAAIAEANDFASKVDAEANATSKPNR